VANHDAEFKINADARIPIRRSNRRTPLRLSTVMGNHPPITPPSRGLPGTVDGSFSVINRGSDFEDWAGVRDSTAGPAKPVFVTDPCL
jgi:hypothetical protein